MKKKRIKILKKLLKKFFKVYTGTYNAPRIRNWGGERPGFSYLKELSDNEINHILENLTKNGFLKLSHTNGNYEYEMFERKF